MLYFFGGGSGSVLLFCVVVIMWTADQEFTGETLHPITSDYFYFVCVRLDHVKEIIYRKLGSFKVGLVRLREFRSLGQVRLQTEGMKYRNWLAYDVTENDENHFTCVVTFLFPTHLLFTVCPLVVLTVILSHGRRVSFLVRVITCIPAHWRRVMCPLSLLSSTSFVYHCYHPLPSFLVLSPTGREIVRLVLLSTCPCCVFDTLIVALLRLQDLGPNSTSVLPPR